MRGDRASAPAAVGRPVLRLDAIDGSTASPDVRARGGRKCCPTPSTSPRCWRTLALRRAPPLSELNRPPSPQGLCRARPKPPMRRQLFALVFPNDVDARWIARCRRAHPQRGLRKVLEDGDDGACALARHAPGRSHLLRQPGGRAGFAPELRLRMSARCASRALPCAARSPTICAMRRRARRSTSDALQAPRSSPARTARCVPRRCGVACTAPG